MLHRGMLRVQRERDSLHVPMTRLREDMADSISPVKRCGRASDPSSQAGSSQASPMSFQLPLLSRLDEAETLLPIKTRLSQEEMMKRSWKKRIARRIEAARARPQRGISSPVASQFGSSLDESDFKYFKRALQMNCFCSTMDDDEVLELAQRCELFVYESGEEIVKQGEPGTHFFVVKSGELAVTSETEVIKRLGPADSFGEVALVHNSPQWSTVSAERLSRVWGVHSSAFLQSMWNLASRSFLENFGLLSRIKIFQFLQESQLRTICQELVALVFSPGTEVVREGTWGDCVYVVKSGTLHCQAGGQRIANLGPGDFFGERALIYNEPRHVTVTATVQSTCISLRRQVLERVLGSLSLHMMYHNIVLGALKGSIAFSQFTEEQLRCLVESAIVKEFIPRSIVVDPKGETHGLRFLIVLDGEVVVKAPGKGAAERITREQYFGDDYVCDLHIPFGHIVENAQDRPCKLAIISTEAVTSLVTSDKEQLSLRQRMARLKRVFVFRHLSDRHCKQLAKSCHSIMKHCDEDVVVEGEFGSKFFVIKSGEFLVKKEGRPIRTLGKGDYFGERGLLYNEARTATVTCTSEDAELLTFDKTVFIQSLEEKMLKYLDDRIRLQNTDVTLEDLQMDGVMGVGNFGVVKRVVHKSTGTKYALKCIGRAATMSNQEQQRRLLLEREILLENDHPFILKVVRTFKDRRYLYFLTELVTGGELFYAMRSIGDFLSQQQAQFYSGSILLALESLHERSIVYRDLKPENVLLDGQGFVKLIDFGCAVRLRNKVRRSVGPEEVAHSATGVTFTVIGTSHYMAPEVIMGKGYGPSCDFWSLGVCLYEFVRGILPFGNAFEEPNEVFREILQGKLKFPPEFKSQPAIHILKRLLTRRVESRIGCSPISWSTVKRHDYFLNFDWDKLLSRELTPPLVPGVEVDGDCKKPVAADDTMLEVDVEEDGWDKEF